MKTLKHIGKIKNTGTKLLVIFRTLPGESNMALVLPTATLPDMYHDALIQLVETDQAQDANEFGEIMFSRRFQDGRQMLTAMQQDNRLQKVATDSVIMMPTLNKELPLDQLNSIIAEQRNIPIDELSGLVNGGKVTRDTPQPPATAPAISQPVIEEPLSDQDLAKKYRSDAYFMFTEASRLRKAADELDPPAKKATPDRKAGPAKKAVASV